MAYRRIRDYCLKENDIANAQAKLDILEWKFADDQAESVRLHVQQNPDHFFTASTLGGSLLHLY